MAGVIALDLTISRPFAPYLALGSGFPLDSLSQFEHISRLEKHCGENDENSYWRHHPSY